MPKFDVPCGHEKCQVMAEIAEDVYKSIVNHPRAPRLLELVDDILDDRDLVWAVMEHVGSALLRQTMSETFWQEWGYGHSN